LKNWEATVEVTTNGRAIDNDSENVNNTLTGYVQFAIVTEQDGSLSVYGTRQDVLQLSDSGNLNMTSQAYTMTILCGAVACAADGSNSVFGADTVCPNTRKLSDNATDAVPWPQMLRSSALPKPPTCIPSFEGNCPIQ
jgi:hypothetical protein